MAAPPAATPLPQLPPDHPAQGYAALPARQLIAQVQAAGREPQLPASQAVYAALYYRYLPYLSRVAANALRFIYDRGALQEVVNDALAAFFRASSRFDLNRATDDAACDGLVRAYLAQLTRWKAGHARSFQQSFSAEKLDLEELDRRLHDLAACGASEMEPSEEPAADPRAQEVARWFDSLRSVEQDVVRTYFFDLHAGRKSARLPDGVAQCLAAKHCVTTSNIRHLKAKLQRQLRENFRALK